MILRKIRHKISNTSDFYGIYLSILNNFLPVKLTDTEILILKHLYLSGKVLTTEVRKQIRDLLSISEKNLNNFVSKLTKRAILVENKGGKTINAKFLPPEGPNTDSIILQLEFPIENGENSTDRPKEDSRANV